MFKSKLSPLKNIAKNSLVIISIFAIAVITVEVASTYLNRNNGGQKSSGDVLGNVSLGTDSYYRFTGPSFNQVFAQGAPIPAPWRDISGDVNISGNLGIGNTAPAQKLDVAGNVKVSGQSYFTGNVGVGTTTPGGLMDLKGNNVPFLGQLRLQSADYDQITFYNSGGATPNATNRLGDIYYDIGGASLNLENNSGSKYILLNPFSTGNVGINTTAPSRTLDLNTNGQIGFSGIGYSSTGSPGMFWYSDNLNYGIYKTAGSWTPPNYQQLMLNWNTGIVIDGGAAYGKSGTSIQPNGGNTTIGGNLTLTGSLNSLQFHGPYGGWSTYGYYHLGAWADNGWGPSVLVARSYYADTAGSASSATTATNATNATYATYLNTDAYNTKFHWSGQGGQPSWLWGSTDGVNTYVYNPSNFSVNYANTAGNLTGTFTSSAWNPINFTYGGYYTQYGTFRSTPNVHVNTPNGFGLLVNWDSGSTYDASVGQFAVGNGAGSALFATYRNGNSYVNNRLGIRNGGPNADLTITQTDDSQWGAGGISTWSTNGYYSRILLGSDAQLYLFAYNNNNYCIVPTGGQLSCASDRRLKENIKTLSINALDVISALKPSTFTWKSNGKHDSGFIAQDVETVIPEAVNHNEKDGYLSLSDGNFTPYIVKALQELDAKTKQESDKATQTENQVTNLTRQVNTQQAEIEQLKQELEELKKSK